MFQVTQLLFLTVIVIQSFTVTLEYDVSRYFSIVWLVILLGIVVGKLVQKKRDFPPLNLPMILLSCGLLVSLAIHRFEFKLVLNSLQFMIAIYTIYLILYYVVYYEDYNKYFTKTFLSLTAYFYFVLIFSTVLTAYNLPGAPPVYFWLCDGVDERAQLVYSAGNHFGVYLSVLSLISGIYLVWQRKWIHLLTVALSIYFLIVSGARLGQIAILLLAVVLIFRFLKIRMIIAFYLIAFAGVIIYLIIFNQGLYYYVYEFFTSINEKIHLRFIPPEKYHLLAGREVLWSTLVEMIHDKPLWGHGYYIPFYDFGIDVAFENGKVVGNESAPTSESGLLFTVRYGIIATLFYLFFMVKPLFKKKLDQLDFYHFYVILFAVCVWILNDSLFISYSIQILFFFFIIACQIIDERDRILKLRAEQSLIEVNRFASMHRR